MKSVRRKVRKSGYNTLNKRSVNWSLAFNKVVLKSAALYMRSNDSSWLDELSCANKYNWTT